MSATRRTVRLLRGDGSGGAERVAPDEVVPAAFGANLDFVGQEVAAAACYSLELRIGEHALAAASHSGAEDVPDNAQVTVGAQWAPATHWLCSVAGGPQQVWVCIARLGTRNHTGLHIGQQAPTPEPVVDRTRNSWSGFGCEVRLECHADHASARLQG